MLSQSFLRILHLTKTILLIYQILLRKTLQMNPLSTKHFNSTTTVSVKPQILIVDRALSI